jgi:ankyrin repeat protein
MFSPFEQVCVNGNLEIIKLFFNSGKVIINNRDVQGRTALHYTANMGNNPEVIDLLIKNGFDINIQDYEGKTPLICAVMNGKTDNVKTLLKYPQIDTNIKDNKQLAAMDYVIGNDQNNQLTTALANASINVIQNNR